MTGLSSLLIALILFTPQACTIYRSADHPNRFSRFGDSNTVPAVYMGYYSNGYPWNTDLNDTAEYFNGSFSRNGLANGNGWSVLDGLNTLDAEIAEFNPGIALISYGANWNGSPTEHTAHLQELVEKLLDQDVLPILSTVTGNPSVNSGIRQVATEYGLPLFDWEPIGRNYLSEDGVHLTVKGWDVHSYYGLLVLDKLREECQPVQDYEWVNRIALYERLLVLKGLDR